MSWDERYDGYATLEKGDESYGGYVVRIHAFETEEIWYTYAQTEEPRRTFWIGKSGSQEDARTRLERLRKEGWRCEIYVAKNAGHCLESATVIRHTYTDEKTAKRIRLLLCGTHQNVCADWEGMLIGEYISTYNGLVQDAPIIGDRIMPKQ